MKHILRLLILCAWSLPALANPQATAILNDMRADKRRAPVAYSKTLEHVAAGHARDMGANGYFSHTGANGSSVGDRVKAQGYQWCFVAENIAKGQRDLTAAMAGWKSSKGHYKNMMHKKAAQFGVAQGPGNLWVMVLAAPC